MLDRRSGRGESRCVPRKSATIDEATFGAQLRVARLDQGLTLEQVAERLGVHRQAVSQWENSANLQEATVRRYASLLGLVVRLE